MASECMTKEQCMQTILTCVEEGVNKWFEIVNTFGLDSNHMTTWQKDLIGEFEACITDCNQLAQEKQHALIGKIEQLLQMGEDLCKTLRIKMPQFTSTNKGLYYDELYLIDQIKLWKDEITMRSAEIDVLKARSEAICKYLGTNLHIPEDPLPSREDMIMYEKQIEKLEAEKAQRRVKFRSLQQKIAELSKEIEFTPNLQFEKSIVHGVDLDEIQLTNDNMLRLTDLHDELLMKRENIEQDLSKLRENVQHLWKVLDEDVKYCNDFIEQHVGINYNTLDAFKKEVKRCEELRKSNIQVFIERLRKELSELWDEAAYSNAKREEFKDHMDDDLYTEDLLTLHDLQIEKVKQHLKENQKMYELLKQRQLYYDKMRDLEKREYAPDRFKNRGGQLLQEEKERRAVKKKIPLIEDKLKELALTYEIEKGEKFMYWDDNIDDLIARDHENMENEKQLLLSARKQKRDLPTTPMSLMKSNNGLSRMVLTPHNNRTAIRTPKTAPVKKNLVPRLSITKAKRRVSTEKKKRIVTIRSRMRQQTLFPNDDYSEFKSEMSSREACRSTMNDLASMDIQ